ncbi:hypothetical protein [Empedobacter brevis]|uniref:hypothetical protein n=1 Tax=Empedobacter brevis TaxID=247 RepID=UPI002896B99B|nr:hypothetical protein [Empedobacter brevis]
MKKHLIILMSLFSSVSLFSQVGINTENPQQLFHTDGKSSAATINPTTGAPSVEQQADDVVITNQGRIGIGVTTPTQSLDVNGRTRIRNTDVLTSTSVSPIFVDENGLVGKANINPQSQIAFYSTTTAYNASINSFNNGDNFIVPVIVSHSVLNTINATIPSTGNIRISENGNYMISGSVTPQLDFKNDGDGYGYIAVNLDISTNNGSSWTSISGGRPLFPRVVYGAVRNYSFTIPTVIRNLNVGTLIRINIYRTKTNDGTLQGSTFNEVKVGSSYGAPTFTLSITKL